MKPCFEDLTHQEFSCDHPFYTGIFAFIFLLFFIGTLQVVNILLFWEYDRFDCFAILVSMAGGVWMLCQSGWLLFYLPRRIHFIFTSPTGSLIVTRDYPCKALEIPENAELTYAIAPGNYRLDLVQRGNSPRAFNIWFEYQGKQFWLSEASSNYREALYLLAEHTKLRHDPRLHRWERYIFWIRWREHLKARPHLSDIIEEVHCILALKQVRPEPLPAENASPSVDAENEAVNNFSEAQSTLIHEELEEEVIRETEFTQTALSRKFGSARLKIENNRMVLVLKQDHKSEQKME